MKRYSNQGIIFYREENIVGKRGNAGYQHFQKLLTTEPPGRATSLLKTLWKKEKLLVMSNFSFSHNVLYPFAEVSVIFIECELFVCKPFQFRNV